MATRETLDYSLHESIQGHSLEIDRRGKLLQIEMKSPWGDSMCAEFTEAEAEEIAASFARTYRNIRMSD